jgi:hypothetical protein
MLFTVTQTRILLNEWQEAQGVVGINNFIDSYQLSRSERVVVVDGTETTVAVVVTGETERSAQAGTKEEYHQIWNQVRSFSVLREDWQSACILTRHMCPTNPLPVRPSTICEYMRFKYQKPGTIVCEYGTQTPILVRHGSGDEDVEVLEATGDWHSPMVINKFRASLKYLHRLYNHLREGYSPSCDFCVAINQENNVAGFWGACPQHAGRPCLLETGSPVNSIQFTDECKFASIQLIEHIPVGALCLLPGDIRDLRRALLGADLQGYQVYVMILLGIKLFLRSSELLNLRMEQFEKKLYIVNDEEVRAIALYVKGKSDRQKKYLYIWADEYCPEFCPLRHLLVYLALTGIRTGLLFPYFTRSQSPLEVPETAWRYAQWRVRLRTLVTRHCESKKGSMSVLRIGTHTLRKTGYLYAVFGVMRFNGHSVTDGTVSIERGGSELQFAAILKSARHSTVQNAMTYFQDTSTMYEAIQQERFPAVHKVGAWKSIYIRDVGTFQCISSASHLRKKDVTTLAEYYVLHKHSIPTDGTMTIGRVIGAVLDAPPPSDVVKNLLERFKKECNISLYIEFKDALEEVVQVVSTRTRAETISNLNYLDEETKNKIRTGIKVEQSTHSMLVRGIAPEVLDNIPLEDLPALPDIQYLMQTAAVPTTKKRGRGKTEELTQYRSAYTSTKVLCERVGILMDVDAYLGRTYHSKTSDLNEAARTFYQKHVVRVALCVSTCHAGNVEAFTSIMGTILGTNLFSGFKYQCRCGTVPANVVPVQVPVP